MIKIENMETYGWEAAIRGMRNPMNSWAKSDSDFSDPESWHIGQNDLDLMVRLIKSGPDHRKFLRMIGVTMDVTAPMYWWSEADTYRIGTVRNSCSKMHKLLSKPFELSDFSFDQLPGYRNEVEQFAPEIDDELEQWTLCHHSSDYYVSNYGRIRHNGRILAGSLHQDGYVLVTIKGKQYPVHRLVAECYIENPEDKPEVNHIDGNKQNNQVSNLEWVTRSENALHAVKNGLQPKPVRVYKGKFSQDTRDEIKALWNAGVSSRDLADKYGVSKTCILSIVHDKYRYADKVDLYATLALPWVDTLNELRDSYLSCDDEEGKKRIWYTILQLLPESYNQRSTLSMNYEVLRNIYHARKDHKLDEWHVFCETVENYMPYAKELIAE